jgi:hypothetical protein
MVNQDECPDQRGARIARQQEVTANEKQWTIRLYPNPASTEVVVHSSAQNEIVFIRILDLSGRTLSRQSIKLTGSTAIIDLNLFSGAYIVEILNTNNERIIKKLLISK